MLDRVAADYGVQPRFIVALWGIESNYGSFTGEFPVIGALATLAYEGRRAAFFRKELLQALRIVDQGDVAPAQMMGSWAGAMGQSQFMPSSYLAHAVDYDGDGRRDIWTTPARRVRFDRQLSRQGRLERPAHLGPPGADRGPC